MEPNYKSFEEQVFFSTLRIERPSANSMGTGFLVEVPSCREGQKYVFLVSNKHVLDDPQTETRLSFHLKDSEGNPKLGESFGVNVLRFTGGYYCSDDNDVDLALLNISEFMSVVQQQTGKEVYYRSLTTQIFADYKEPDFFPNKQIVFIGYPNNRYDTKNFLPILRGGVLASIPKVDFEGKPHVLVDAQVFQGSSGSPVFTTLEGKWKFMGVIFQAMVRNQKVQIIETSQESSIQEMLGIGLVVKSTCVLDLINKAKIDLDRVVCKDQKANG